MSSDWLSEPMGSLLAWLAILVIPLASLLDMISGRFPGDSTLTPLKRGGSGETGLTNDCVSKVLEEEFGDVDVGIGDDGLIRKDVLSLVPKDQVLKGEGDIWIPPSCDTSRVNGSLSSVNVGCV